MGLISPTLPTVGQPRGSEETDSLNALTALVNVVNGNLDSANLANGAVDVAELASALASILGVSQSGSARRGKSIIATEESRTNVAYGKLTTPDEVTGIVLPTDGLLCVAYQAMWKESVDGAARAAFFLGANQLQHGFNNGAVLAVQQAACQGAANVYSLLASSSVGLYGGVAADTNAYPGHATTGQLVGTTTGGTTWDGGCAVIFAAAGTYDVSVQFKASSGSVTAKERKLWVWTMGF